MVSSYTALLALCSSVSVHAFFPIHQTSAEAANRLGGFKYEAAKADATLKERGQEADAPGVFISIAPFRSNTRYRVRSPPAQQRSSPVIRDNQYQVVSANSPSQSNSVAIDEDGTDYSYFSTITVGSKAEKMFMLVDTGSSVTWVMDDACNGTPCGMHNTFASSQSSTLKPAGSKFSLDYGTGEVSGSYATDSFNIAGMSLTIPIGLADSVSDDFRNYPFDGILGLGRVPLDGAPTTTFIQALGNAKTLPANVFGLNLQRHADGTADGQINFGAPDTSKYHGDLNYVNTITDKSFWQVPADDILVDGKSVSLNEHRTAILDTGTSYMLIPPNDAKALFGAVDGAKAGDNGYWNVPCDAKADIQVVLGGVGYSINPKDYVGAPSGGACVSNIVGVSAVGNDQTWLLGDTFLKNVYTVFDADKDRVGFGAKSGSTKVNGGSSTSSSASSASSTAAASSSSGASSSLTGTTLSSASAHAGATHLGLPAIAGTTSTADAASQSGVAVASPAAGPSTNGSGRHMVGGWIASLAFGLAVSMAF